MPWGLFKFLIVLNYDCKGNLLNVWKWGGESTLHSIFLLNLALSVQAKISSRYSSLAQPSLGTSFPSSNLSQINEIK